MRSVETDKQVGVFLSALFLEVLFLAGCGSSSRSNVSSRNLIIRKLRTYYRTVGMVAFVIPVLTVTTTARADVNLETFVMATTGQTNFFTWRAPDAVENNFGGFGTAIPSNALSDPTILASDNVAGTYRVADDPAATKFSVLTDAAAIAGSGKSTFGTWAYSGNTAVATRMGQLKSQSHSVFTGNGDNATINSAESYGMFRDTFGLNDGSAKGTHSTMKIAMTIDGNMSMTGIGSMGMLLRYGYGSNPVFNNPSA